jgi:apolipoprotein N-acyltransferase
LKLFGFFFGVAALTLSFPTAIDGYVLPDLGFLIWVALVPLFIIIRHVSAWRAALITFCFAVLYNALVSYWIIHATYVYGGLSSLASLATLLAMATLLGLMLMAFLWVARYLSLRHHVPWTLSLPALWILHEWARSYGPFGGYPWSNLAYTQSQFIHLIQSADLFGVYGLSFLIVLINAIIAQICLIGGNRRYFPWRSACIALLLLLSFYSYGSFRLERIQFQANDVERISVVLVQPNIPQSIKWVPEQANTTIKTLTGLSREASQSNLDLIVWPEASYPDSLPSNLSDLSEPDLDVPLVMGLVAIKPWSSGDQGPVMYNSALLRMPEGEIKNWYFKSHLVPMGEYVPLKNVLTFLKKIVPALGDFEAGDGGHPFELHNFLFGITICYEDLFAEISRRFVREGAHFITNLTNDAWYGWSSAPYQHAVFSQFRAIENRRAMLRATNTGLTRVYSPTGRILSQLPLYQEGYLTVRVPLMLEKSFYTQYGEWPLMIFLILLLAIVGMIAHKKTHDSNY